MLSQNNHTSYTSGFFALLSLPATAMGFALSVQISALSWLLSTQYHLDIEQVGYVWMAGPLAGILGQLIVGLVSDGVWFWGGRRRPFILVGGSLAALMLLALPFLRQIGNALGLASLMGVAITVALVLDLAINVSFNPTRSLIADLTPEGPLRTKGYTWMQTVSGSFGVLAYLISVWQGNYVLIYLGAGLVLLGSVVPTLLLTEPRSLHPETAAPATATQVPALIKICLAHAFTWLGVQTMFVYLFAYAQYKLPGLDKEGVGQVIAISFAVLNTVGFLLPAPVLGPLAKRFGQVRVHLVCLAVMAVGYGLIAWLGVQVWVLYALMAVVGVGWAATVSLPFAILSERVNKTRMGFYMGLFNLSVVLPQLVVSGVLGKIIQQHPDKSLIFIIAAGSLAVSAALWLTVRELPPAPPQDDPFFGSGH
ncbi:MAG: MFS transporter [Bernardetiaceae bacterium]|nr:MFS transporter [Bernardetiaceae bacterium]